jgi:IS4 transposase
VRFGLRGLLRDYHSNSNYPEKLRRIYFFGNGRSKRVIFLGNNFSLPDTTFPQLYRWYWKIELLFKKIKQHLGIKAFYGTSENAVKNQI